MTRSQRRVHRALWLLLVPALVIALVMAIALRPPEKPAPDHSAQEATR